MSTPARGYAFGLFRLEPAEKRLTRDGQPVPLTPKAFDTLHALVARHGHLVTKAELLEQVWSDAVVEENTLSQNISALRKALDEGRDNERYIETVPRRGFRFVADIQELHDPAASEHVVVATRTRAQVVVEEEEEEEETPNRSVRWAVAASRRRHVTIPLTIAASIVVFAAGLLWMNGSRGGTQASAGLPAIAVLPFKVVSASPGDDYLGIGFTHALIARLGRFDQIRLRPSGAVRQYVGSAQDPIAIGRDLEVDQVVEGSIQRAGRQLRVAVQLVDVGHRATTWTTAVDATAETLFGVQDRLADEIARALSIERRGRGQWTWPRSTRDAAAYEAYLKGWYFWGKRTTAGRRQATAYFGRAIESDPGYVAAYASLADVHFFSGRPQEAYPLINKALAIDPNRAEPHASLGVYKVFQSWDWEGAEADFRRAIALDDSYPPAHHWYAVLQSAIGRLDEAKAEIYKALEVDPLSLAIMADAGRIHYFAGEFDRAIDVLQKALEIEPEFHFAYKRLYEVYVQQHRYREAIEAYRTFIELDRRAGTKWPPPPATNSIRELWRVELSRLTDLDPPTSLAVLHAQLGERDRALVQLERGCKLRDFSITFMAVDPVFRELHDEPRFHAVLQCLGVRPR